ncbi:unnamed protein product, partial [Arabidopsis halleri]
MATGSIITSTSSPSSSSDKLFGISQIKAYVPIVLDMEKLNYDSWRELFETHCISFGVLGHLDGTTKLTDDNETQWKERDGLVKMWIYGTISASILDTVLKKKCSAKELWLSLESLFHDNKEAQAIEFENELRSISIGDLGVHEYCLKIKTLSDLLANLDSPVSERALVTHMLNGLTDKFDFVLNSIKHRSPFPTFAIARSMLLSEEKRLKRTMKPTPTHHQTSSAPDVLYTSTESQSRHGQNSNYGSGGRGHRGRGRGGRNGNRGRGRYNNNHNNNWSYGYQQPWQYGSQPWPQTFGHTMSPTYPPSGYHPQPSYSHPAYAQTPQQGLLGAAPSRSPAEAHFTHPTTPLPPGYQPQYLPMALTHAFNTMTLQEPYDPAWVWDSGATNHIASSTGSLRPNFNPSIFSSITVGNGSSAPVTCRGSGILTSPSRNFKLNDVLVCPSIIKNLLSVRKFVTDNSCSLEFDPFGFCVKDLHTRTKLLRCNSQGPLYSVPSHLFTSSPQALTISTPNHFTWHRRLGHPNHSTLQQLLSSLSISYNKNDLTTLCQACQLGKHLRQPFYESHSFVSEPFDIIHSDIWTSPIMSTHFNRKIKSLQCDNGGEFENRSFRDQLAADGTTLRLSCPYTSQQNGRAERMLRTINNLVRTLLFQASMPPTFWVEALHTAAYLINILPSSAIKNEVPFTKLLGRPARYSHLRTFGCLCYPNLLPMTPHKLAPRSTPCVFLGYPPDHSGYRCMELSSRKIIISRHVTFDEAQFPFASQPPYEKSPSNTSTSDPPSPISRPPSMPTPPPDPLPSTTPPAPPNSTNPPAPLTSTIPFAHLPTQNTHSMTTRSKSGIVKPRTPLCLHTDTISPLPSSHVQAAKDPFWTNAMDEEYHALIKKGTWTLVPRPKATNIIRSLCILDQSLFIYSHGRDLAYLLLYVDDIVLTASSTSLLNNIIAQLSSDFDMTDLGHLHHFLGISVIRDKTGLFLHQQNYAADILHRADMVHCNPCLTPVD